MQITVLDADDDSVIAYTALPEDAKLAIFEGFANAAQVVELRDTSMQEGKDASRGNER